MGSNTFNCFQTVARLHRKPYPSEITMSRCNKNTLMIMMTTMKIMIIMTMMIVTVNSYSDRSKLSSGVGEEMNFARIPHPGALVISVYNLFFA